VTRSVWSPAWLAALCVAACGPAQAPLPLLAPLPASHTLTSGVQLVLVDADLPALAETVSTLGGKTLQVVAAPWPVPGAPGHVLGPLSTPLQVAGAQAEWLQPTTLQLQFTLTQVTLPLSLGVPGQAACAMSWTAQGGLVRVTLRLDRDPQGQVAVIAGQDPEVTWQKHGLISAQTCLQPPLTDAPAQIDAHLLEAVQATLVPQLTQASVHVLQAVFPPALELQGRLSTATRWGDAVEVRVSTQYQPQAGGTLAEHKAGRGIAALAVGLDVDRAACAVDVPPPDHAAETPLAPTPPSPSASTFVRRALVLDKAMLAHLGWAMGRGGALCQETEAGLADLGVGWAAEVLPALADWVQGPPVGARFWPAASPEVQVVDTPAGPALQWQVASATLEIVARVAETDLVVLKITGPFQAIVRPVLQGGGALGLDLLSAQVDGAVVTSPLLPDTTGADAHLGPLVDAALHGIFRSAPVLPLGLALPPGTVATGLARSGDALWLWLEGGIAP
jgi:hypothetical protein